MRQTCRCRTRLLTTVGKDVGVLGELVAASENVSSVLGVGSEASNDRRHVAVLVVEVIGVLSLDECLGDTGKGFGSGEGTGDNGSTVVVKLALFVLGSQSVSGELWKYHRVSRSFCTCRSSLEYSRHDLERCSR